MKNQELFIELERILDVNSILKHPFYQKWNAGELTINDLKYYVKQYNYFVEHFPMFVSSVHSNCLDKTIRKILVENIADEEGFKTGIPDHPQLWKQFANSLGVLDEELKCAVICDEVKYVTEEFYKLCKDSNFLVGLATLYAYERQIPEVSKVKIEGLKKFYKINNEKALEFFAIHQEVDKYHSKSEIDAILSSCKTEDDRRSVIAAVEKATKLYWMMLDGIYSNL